MTELDFDELDRAVNSLIGQSGTGPKVPPTERTLDIASSIPDDAVASSSPTSSPSPQQASDVQAPVEPPASDVVAPSVAQTTDITPTPSSSPLVAKRSTGRFMDVVHPSSDMRATTLTRTATVTPVLQDSSMPAPAVTETSPASVDLTAPTTPTIDSLPVSTPSEQTAVRDEDTALTASIQELGGGSQNDTEIASSPFLSDAKVEKRPLGAFSTEALVGEEAVTPEDGVSHDSPTPSPDQAGPTAVEPATTLPAELQSDLLSVESADTISSIDMAQEPTEQATGPVAITQQYREETSTGDQKSGAIFDTTSYHKALAHPASSKKKHHFTILFWIIGFVILGVAAGATVYFFVLPSIR